MLYARDLWNELPFWALIQFDYHFYQLELHFALSFITKLPIYYSKTY
jgi:hypothetical protein